MPLVTISLTDDQIKSLLDLASELRTLTRDLRDYFAKRRGAIKPRGRQVNPHRIDVADDPWIDWFSEIEGSRVTTRSIMKNVLGRSDGVMSPYEARRIAACMQNLGWDGPKMLRIEGKAVRGYERAPTADL